MREIKELTLQNFKNAKKTLDESGVLRKTNLIFSDYLSELVEAFVYLKPENFQRTGSFKMRGAAFTMSILSEEEKKKGVIAASAGNHAQGLALAALKFGVKCTIVMPETAPKIKVENTLKYKANVVLKGQNYDEAYAHAKTLEKEFGLTYIHAYDNLSVATGGGTISIEILEELPDADIILVPIGGGGLSSGVATCAKLLNPDIKVIGVEPAGAACVIAALDKGEAIKLDKVNTIADGAQIGKAGTYVLPYLQKYLDGIIKIEDDSLIESMLDFVENQKMIAEPAGLLTVAAIKKIEEIIPDIKDKKIVSIVSGGNIDPNMVSLYIQHGLRKKGRIFTFSASLPQQPGTLNKISEIIANKGGNILEVKHDHFVSVNKNEAVEIIITLEVANEEVKEDIIRELKNKYSIALK